MHKHSSQRQQTHWNLTIGAYQLAGFRHVIGTLWEVNDESCVDIERVKYEWMQKQGLSDASVSEGLHRACTKLRSVWSQ